MSTSYSCDVNGSFYILLGLLHNTGKWFYKAVISLANHLGEGRSSSQNCSPLDGSQYRQNSTRAFRAALLIDDNDTWRLGRRDMTLLERGHSRPQRVSRTSRLPWRSRSASGGSKALSFTRLERLLLEGSFAFSTINVMSHR